MKYLYGASAQAIQNFIFNTSKLKEIIGASEIIEQICTSKFAEALGLSENELQKDHNAYLNAAGKIIYLFENKIACQDFVYSFSKKIAEFAPGISFQNAIVEVENTPKSGDFENLEKKLQEQRLRVGDNLEMGLMINERARRTGKPGIMFNDNEVLDASQWFKQELSVKTSLLKKFTGKDSTQLKDRFPSDFKEIVKNESKQWIGIIHIDGNNIGKVIKKLSELSIKEHYREIIKNFSDILGKCTLEASQMAFNKIFASFTEQVDKIPVRPVIIGGDDITIVIRGDLALDFTKEYLHYFEENSRKYLKDFIEKYELNYLKNGLSSCAGIAYIKSKYPFHYGVKLANDLCEYSKKESKAYDPENVPSCLSFHKVQSSFTNDYEDIVKNELLGGNVYFNYGPYYLSDIPGKPTISELVYRVNQIEKADAPKSGLRKWLSELHNNEESANMLMERIIKLNERFKEPLKLNNPIEEVQTSSGSRKKTHIYDLLTISGIK
jgi:hypothetical protein